MAPGNQQPPAQAAPVSEQQFVAAFEFAPIGMALLDMDSTVLRVNHAELGRDPRGQRAGAKVVLAQGHVRAVLLAAHPPG